MKRLLILILTAAIGSAQTIPQNVQKTPGTNAITAPLNLGNLGTATTQSQGDNSTKIATTAYVDAALADFEIKDPVVAATTTALLFSPTYANGSSGVGATLTGGIGVLVVDGYTPVLNDRILVKNQSSTLTQGIYYVSRLGTIGVGYILTRSLDFNQAANILYGDSVAVLQGTVNANQQYTMNNQNAISVGTTAITFAQTSGGSQLTAGAGISITGNTVAMSIAPAANGGFGTAAAIKLTYTGTPAYPMTFAFMPGTITVPASTVSGQASYAMVAGPGVFSFAYTEAGDTVGSLLTLSFDDLVVLPNLQPTNVVAMTSLAFPELLWVNNLNPSIMPALTTLSLPKLARASQSFAPSTMAALTTLSCPLLVSVGTSFAPTTMALVTTFSFPALAYVGTTFAPTTMAALTTMSCNALKYVGGNFSITSMASLATVSFSGMVQYGGTIAMNSSNGNISACTLGTIGTLKSIAGATINISGQKLPSSEVNAILALLVSLDGTNGTTLWGTGKTLTINGGTNGAPTGQGATDKTTLQGRGATITTN